MLPQKYQRLFVVSLVASLLLTAIYFFAPERKLVLNPSQGHKPISADDRAQGGQTVAEVSYNGDQLQLSCDISTAYQWPYCEAIFERPVEDAWDLTHYDKMRISIASEGKGPQNIKIYLRNHKVYSTAADRITRKINEIQFDPNDYEMPLTVPLASFRVAPWWITSTKRPSIDTNPELNNITTIDISTGDFRKAGKHTIILDYIEFAGPMMRLEQLLSLLLIIWASFGVWVGASSFCRDKA